MGSLGARQSSQLGSRWQELDGKWRLGLTEGGAKRTTGPLTDLLAQHCWLERQTFLQFLQDIGQCELSEPAAE